MFVSGLNQRKFLTYMIILGLLCGLMTGCQLLNPYESPLTPTPDHWKNQEKLHSSSSSTPDESQEKEREPCYEDVCYDFENWWKIFQDPILNQLEECALDSSYTLWSALDRVIEARAQARIHFAPLLPAINFAPSFTRTGLLYQNPITGLGSSASTSIPQSSSLFSLDSNQANTANNANSNASMFSNIPKDFRFIQSQYLIPLNLTYELDLWGQLNHAYYASLIRAQAASQAYLSVLLSLTADIASAYFQLRGLDAQQEVIQKNIIIRQRAYDISLARYNAGIVTYLDVSRAETELARAHADSDDVYRLRGLQENIIATLVGVPASVFSIHYQPLHAPPPLIPSGIPSELLTRRPDIGEAERNLAAAYEDIGVAYANFFPSLQINAAFGFESPFAYQLLNWRSRFWQVGWNILQSVFDAGRNQANYDYYRARFSEAMANYQQQVLYAFQDVEDALVNIREYAKQAHDLSRAVKAANKTLELSEMRYNRGLVNYLDVVDAERQLLETEQNSAIILGNRYHSTVMLIRALGGSWDQCPSQ